MVMSTQDKGLRSCQQRSHRMGWRSLCLFLASPAGTVLWVTLVVLLLGTCRLETRNDGTTRAELESETRPDGR